MAISCRMRTLGEGEIQGNSKWKDYHHPPISSQIPAQCFYCREGKKSCLPRPKADDRTCQHCGKEFRYPSFFKRHLKTRCGKQVSKTASRLIRQEIQASCTSKSASQASQATIPIQLFLVE